MKLVKWPSQILKQKAEPLSKIDGKTIKLIEKMFEVMYKADGVGLAAPQVGRSVQLFTVDLTSHDINFKGALINPKLVDVGIETEVDEEGCLSLPGLYINLERPKKIIISGITPDEKEIVLELKGFAARVFLHELDHLNGTLIIDHLSDEERRRILKEWQEKKEK